MAYECFDLQTTDRVAHLRMTRPERANSMIASFWRDLPVIVDELSAAGKVRALVLSAEGRHFCSGMDLEVFAGNDTLGAEGASGAHRSRRNEAFRTMAMRLQDSFTALERARMPVLCAIQGACVGGGVDMVCAADLRYATESAYFSIAEINIGMTAEIAEKPPIAVWGTKQTMHYTRDHSVADGLEYIANWNAAMFDTADMGEAFRAQAEGRRAEFPDLYPTSDGL